MDNQLSPSPLGRAAWAEKALYAAVKIGTRQYFIIAAGYDTFAYRQPAWAEKLQVIEFDHPLMSEDKQTRIRRICKNKPNNLTYIPINLTTESIFEKARSCSLKKDKLSFTLYKSRLSRVQQVEQSVKHLFQRLNLRTVCNIFIYDSFIGCDNCLCDEGTAVFIF